MTFFCINFKHSRRFIVLFSNSPRYNTNNSLMKLFITHIQKSLIWIDSFFRYPKCFILKSSSLSINIFNFFNILDLICSFTKQNSQTIIRTFYPSSSINPWSNNKSNMIGIYILFKIQCRQKSPQ